MAGFFFHKFFTNIRRYSLPGAIVRMVLKVTGRTVVVGGSCHGCGRCCRKINLEGRKGWLRSESDFSQVVQRFPDYNRFVVVEKDEQGFLLFSCSVLTETGLCGEYEQRPRICRKFPDPSLYFSGGRLPVGCGYHFNISRNFQPFLKRALKQEYENKRNIDS